MKIYSIQYLRGLAAVSVLIAHVLLQPLAALDQNFVRVGTFGVLLFFVISGFVMVVATDGAAFNPFDFIRKRLQRVVPLYWAATFFTAMVCAVAPWALKNTTLTTSSLLHSLFFIPFSRANGEMVPLMKLGWTLNYEMFFYGIFACAFWLPRLARVCVVSAILGILVVAGLAEVAGNGPLYYYTRPVILTFCVGMVTGLVASCGPLLSATRRFSPLIILVSMALLGAGFLVKQGLPPNPVNDALFALGSGGLVLFFLGVDSQVPKLRVLSALGNASYSIYLTHIYFVVAVPMIASSLFPSAPPLLVALASILSSLMASFAVYVYFERPIQKIFQKRRGAAPLVRLPI